MDNRYFVWIRVEDENAKRSGGTGYLLTDRCVLTAWHVVRGAKTIKVAYDLPEQSKSDQKKEYSAAELLWRETESEFDLALLSLTKPVTEFRVYSPRIVIEPPSEAVKCHSHGWAGAKPGETVFESLTPFQGEAQRFGAKHEYFDFVNDRKINYEAWQGISGAPIFEQGGEQRLFGVVGELHPEIEKTIQCAPISRAYYDEEFQKESGLEHRRLLIAKLVDLLTSHPDAAQKIAAERSDWEKARQKGVRDFAEKLIDVPDWRQVLRDFDEAHGKSKRDLSTAGVIGEVIEFVLPEIFYLTDLARMRTDGASALRLPIETFTLAEIAMAAYERRAMAFCEQTSHKEQAQGKGLIAQSDAEDRKRRGFGRPELGISTGEELAYRDLIIFLARWILSDMDYERFKKAEKIDPGFLNAAIEDDVEFEEPRSYFVYSPLFRETHRNFLEHLQSDLPALQLVEMEGAGNYLQERKDTKPLCKILFRSYRQRNTIR